MRSAAIKILMEETWQDGMIKLLMMWNGKKGTIQHRSGHGNGNDMRDFWRG
jgi:hypothetical protein